MQFKLDKKYGVISYFLDSRGEYYICTVKTLRFWAWLCIKQIMLLFKTKRHVFLVYWVDILVPFTAWIYFPPFGACFLDKRCGAFCGWLHKTLFAVFMWAILTQYSRWLEIFAPLVAFVLKEITPFDAFFSRAILACKYGVFFIFFL